MKITPLGDSAVLIEVGDNAAKVRSISAALAEKCPPGVFEIVPACTTIAVYYSPLVWAKGNSAKPYEEICAWIGGVVETTEIAKPVPARELVIPVCYGGEFGPDLEELAASKNMSGDDVIRLHSGAIYEVRAIGFSPGFPYMTGLPDALHTPRKATPRTVVPVGSVGIGGSQTGIYTLPTPGGWHLLGRTPLELFRPEENEPAWLHVGDCVRFETITKEQFMEAVR